jgi:hypothetical protein
MRWTILIFDELTSSLKPEEMVILNDFIYSLTGIFPEWYIENESTAQKKQLG